jgi:hypothetical protein
MIMHKGRTLAKRTIFVDYGRANRTTARICWLCNKAHCGSGGARIRDKRMVRQVPLCDACLEGDQDGIVRKYLGAPDLEFEEGGALTSEQLSALADKQDSTEH